MLPGLPDVAIDEAGIGADAVDAAVLWTPTVRDAGVFAWPVCECAGLALAGNYDSPWLAGLRGIAAVSAINVELADGGIAGRAAGGVGGDGEAGGKESEQHSHRVAP